ncbi:MAG TPA: methyltransferase domain-containing protein [Rhodopila sp.]|uniref:methyltransferase domain-containing protein n=1 Tax=Rhodopila sp. TaxID=2480087 RepID=UPI002B7EE228|nr:methyltransferase domain-containing protein [Rhodopila sp.]HVY14169.1 methyltransferase domain-containing protein [Rhodopila sp.]
MSLKTRSTQEEAMDTQCVDYDDYARCLRDLSRVNAVTGTHRPTLAWLARHAAPEEAFSLLDIACGHGDCLRAIRKRFPNARLTGIDLNPWATRAATAATPAEARITFINGDAFAYQPDAPIDVFISSQFAHHLSDDAVVRFLAWQSAHAVRGWFVSDLHRHWFPYFGFPLLARVMGWHRFVRTDGQISIARGFVSREWHALLLQAGVKADVRWHVPFRLCVGSP